MPSSRGAAGPPRTFATFLFTDIEGHTVLWEAAPDQMAVALADHERIIGDAVVAAGGRIVKFEGDAIMAVFEDAGAAVDAARSAQVGLWTASWPGIGHLRVRMGLHCGVAFARGGDYYGPAVIRAARLCDAAHGHQVVASHAVVALVSEHEWIDLGEWELRGLAGVERVYQLAGPGLRAEFPPLRLAATTDDRLPRPRSSFVGRQAELGAVTAGLADRRLVTVTGVGGSGKTRLAIEAVRAALAAFPDGAAFVDLAVVSDGSGIRPAVSQALGLESSGETGDRSRDRLLTYLAPRRAILVLDNCEHLLDSVADLTDELIERTQALRIVATSREALGLDGELVIQIGSLDPEHAVELFVARASGSLDDTATAARICERLDGIPLAIELAAARTSHLALDELASRLDDRFRLLSSRRRVQRQQTLQATLDWSHDLLDEDERALLRRLAVFAGRFLLAAVEGIYGDGDRPVVDTLGSLVERSMVELDPAAGRYRLLETVRLYAEEKLIAAGEAAEFRARHHDWFHEYLRAFPLEETFFHGETSRRLVADLDDLRAALRWSIDTGGWNEAAEIAARMCGPATLVDSGEVGEWAWIILPELDRSSELALLVLLAALWNTLRTTAVRTEAIGERERAVRARTERERASRQAQGLLGTMDLFDTLAAFAERRDDEISVFARVFVAWVRDATARAVGDDARVQAAAAMAERSVELAEAMPPSAWTLHTYLYGAWAAIGAGDLQRVAELLRRCASTRSPNVPVRYEASLATLLHVLGDPDALEMAARARTRAEPNEEVVDAISVLALELAAHGDLAAARQEIVAALSVVPTSEMQMSTTLIAAAGVAFHDGDAPRASRWLATAAAPGSVFTTPLGWLLFRHYLARVRAELAPEEARRQRDEGRSVRAHEAIEEVARWAAE